MQVAIFDYKPLSAKTGIANRALRPTLGLIDPDHTLTMPRNVAAYSGYDVLCHALESYTAIPYHQRSPRPSEPQLRPAYQGANPISDIWALHGLRMCAQYLKRGKPTSLSRLSRLAPSFSLSFSLCFFLSLSPPPPAPLTRSVILAN